MSDTSQSALAALYGALYRLIARLVAGTAALLRAVEHRREIRHLAEFDERALKDIGLTRSDVLGALSQPLYKDPGAPFVVRSVARRVRSRRLALTAKGRLTEAGLTPPARAGA